MCRGISFSARQVGYSRLARAYSYRLLSRSTIARRACSFSGGRSTPTPSPGPVDYVRQVSGWFREPRCERVQPAGFEDSFDALVIANQQGQVIERVRQDIARLNPLRRMQVIALHLFNL